MRIVSPFRDYYDCIQQYGQDDLLYVRRKEVVRYDKPNSYPLPVWGNRWCWPFDLPRGWAITIGFAGKIHYAAQLDRRVCYSPDDVDAEIDRLPKRLRELYHRHPSRRPSRGTKTPHETVRRFFTPEKPPACAGEFFDKAPVWVGREDGGGWHPTVTFNDCLRPLDFMRVLPPYAAWQELYAWLSNQARPFRPIPEIEDKVMAEAKGFDRFSFRKPPDAGRSG